MKTYKREINRAYEAQKDIISHQKDDSFVETGTVLSVSNYYINRQIIAQTQLQKITEFSRSFSAYVEIYVEQILNSIFGKGFADFSKIQKQLPLKYEYPSFDIPINIRIYIEELIKTLPQDKYQKIIGNIHYEELLGFIVELISAHEFEKEIKKDNIAHNVSLIEMRRLQKRNERFNESLRYIETGALSELPIYESKPLAIVHQYRERKLYDCYINNLYGSRIEEIYKGDPKNVLQQLRSILMEEKSIQSVLRYYGMSFENPETNQALLKKVNKLSKK